MSTTRRPATFAELVEIRKVEGSFNELMASQELADWLPGATDALAAVIWAALHNEGEELNPVQRAQAIASAFDEFAEAGKVRVAEAIGKRARVTKGAENHWARGIL
jgi:hypothetical protein